MVYKYSSAGWGGLLIIEHFVPETGERFTSMAAHLDAARLTEWTDVGRWVVRGQQIGVVGPTPVGSTAPHLHFEMRTNLNYAEGPGYSVSNNGWRDPSNYINSHRPNPLNTTTLMETYISSGITSRGLNQYSIENRATALVILVRALERLAGKTLTQSSTPMFVDVPTTAWYYQELVKAWSLGILSMPTDRRFRPADSISRIEMLSLTVKTHEKYLGPIAQQSAAAFVDVQSGMFDAWVYETAQKGFSSGLTAGYIENGGRYFRPSRWTPRSEVVAFVNSLVLKLVPLGISPTVLMSGYGQSGSVAQGAWRYYQITTSALNTDIKFELTNLSNDVDLYVKKGSLPTNTSYDCRPYSGGLNSETCMLPNSGANTWYIGVYGYSSGSFTIKATRLGDGASVASLEPFPTIIPGDTSEKPTAKPEVPDVNAVPEPSTLLLVGGGIAGIFAMLRRRRK